MPTLHPTSLDHIDNVPQSEKDVFEKLKSLDDSYHVFHSLTWTDSRDGECDFVIFHELKGFVTLEVKGGRVEFDGKEWRSTDSEGKTHIIRDPVRQARDSIGRDK